MATLEPFAALRPCAQAAREAAALPYDVMNEEEARQMAEGKPYSFLHVDRAEIDCPAGTDPYSDAVYEKAAENLRRLEDEGVYVQDPIPSYYIYREMTGRTSQTGIVGCASVDEYLDGTIKKHELTRREKEEDRIRHVAACKAHTGPIFLTCVYPKRLQELIHTWMEEKKPVYDFETDEKVRQTVWVIDAADVCEEIRDLLKEVPAFYIADGHHRTASAAHVGERMRKEAGSYTGDEPYNYFLSVLFPSEALNILGYHRVVKDLNGHTPKQLLQMLGVSFEIMLMSGFRCRPMEKHCFGMYLEGEWYHLRAREGSFTDSDPVAALDVSILQKNVLEPMLGISDPRTDERISFVGGSRKLEELEKLADASDGVAFVMYPTDISDLMAIADKGEIMPPKSTWFEPKIYSGLFIHKI
ncbi:MAG: DUF1015 domain-containing protein [Blautia sp.]|jgi:uncharacterized protein (DUF1015 family)